MEKNRKNEAIHKDTREDVNQSQQQPVSDEQDTTNNGITARTSDLLTRGGDHKGTTRGRMSDKLGRTGGETDGQVG